MNSGIGSDAIGSRRCPPYVLHERVDLTWVDPGHHDPRDIAGAVAVLEASRVSDYPHEQVRTTASYEAHLRHGWDGEPPVAAVARRGGGRVLGVLELSLPRRDNTHLGQVDVTVDPLVRRQGIGRELFEIGIERLRGAGRSLVIAEAFDHHHNLAFAKALDLDRAMDEVKRRQELLTLDWAQLDRDFAVAAKAAAGYELVRMPAATPPELMPQVVTMIEAINDAPTEGLEIEDEVHSAERVLAFEAAQVAQRRRVYRLAARHVATGELCGHTVAAVESDMPFFGHQFDTSVLRAHRGHRLGLLLKIAMLRWLAEAEPQLRTLDTWNAASNSHMIAVNERLGYTVVATATGFQRHL